MVNQKYLFDAASEYSYDPGKVEVVGGLARLKVAEAPGEEFVQDFAASAGFAFDIAKTEFAAGVMRQIDQRPANSTFGATFTSGINGSFGGGVLAGVATGGASVLGGKLDLAHNDLRYVDWSAVGNIDGLVQKGCVRIKVTPNYSGIPATGQVFVMGCQTLGSLNNYFDIYHHITGQIIARVYSPAGVVIAQILVAWSPTAGQEYEIEFNFDITAGQTRLFIGGIQAGTTQANTGTRTGAIGVFRSGTNYTTVLTSNFKIDNLLIFTEPQHTANYTPGYTVPEAAFLGDVVTCPTFTYPWLGDLVMFMAWAITAVGIPRFILNSKWWSGAAWVASDSTYAQANTSAEVAANIDTLPASNTLVVKVLWDDSNTQASVDDLVIEYMANSLAVDNPTVMPLQALTVDALYSFLSTIDEPAGSALRFVLQRDGTHMWWNGTAWAASAGYVESNTAAEMAANIASLSVASGRTVRWMVYLHSDTGHVGPEVQELELAYSFWDGAPPVPQKSTVWGHILNADGSPVVGARIEIDLVADTYYEEILLSRDAHIAIADAEGYWEAELIPSSLLAPVTKYRFRFTAAGVEKDEQKTMPVGDTNYADLV